MSNIIQINNLNKSFGSVNAVQNLSFRVKKGELFAFLGINGAGKSTTINIMCGQLSKDSGSVFIDKHDLDKDMDDFSVHVKPGQKAAIVGPTGAGNQKAFHLPHRFAPEAALLPFYPA